MSPFAYEKMGKETVKAFIDGLQKRGRYTFEKGKISTQINLSPGALRKALYRLESKGRIVMVRRGFYVIIPLEYLESGILPPSWFIDQLMNFLKVPYYVGLLSAAALEGAAHQQPQQFQVLTRKQVRPVMVKELSIRYFLKKDFPGTNELRKVKTRTGYIWVSKPELTAIDLLRYVGPSGGINHVATVLLELSEKLSAAKLLRAAREAKNLVYVQRLGTILDYIGHREKTSKLAQWIQSKQTRQVLLDPVIPKGNAEFNEKWSVYVNRELEVDEL